MADDNYHKKGISPLAAGLVGVVVGAVGAVTAILLADKETRQRAKDKAQDLRRRGNLAFEEIRKSSGKMRKEAMEGMERAKEAAKKEMEEKKS